MKHMRHKAAWHDDAHGFHNSVVLALSVLSSSGKARAKSKNGMPSKGMRAGSMCTLAGVLQIHKNFVGGWASFEVAEEEFLQGLRISPRRFTSSLIISTSLARQL